MKYRIIYKTFDGHKLMYHVNSFDIIKDALIKFVDSKTGETKLLPLVNIEIKETGENDGKSI
jgi:hypothetical protein